MKRHIKEDLLNVLTRKYIFHLLNVLPRIFSGFRVYDFSRIFLKYANTALESYRAKKVASKLQSFSKFNYFSVPSKVRHVMHVAFAGFSSLFYVAQLESYRELHGARLLSTYNPATSTASLLPICDPGTRLSKCQ
jgi:hypothetical protein